MTRFILFLIFFFSLLLALLSTHIYFRHDDWLMLGNSVTLLPQKWSLAWENRLFFSPSHDEVWFFRPFFILIIWAAHHFFGLHHSLWILFQWVLWLLTIALGAKTLKKENSHRSHLFFIVVLCSYSLSIGSLVWIGEGMMNIPQVFFLSLALFLFSQPSQILPLLALVPYLIALGFKESSAFLPLALFAVALSTRSLRQKKLSLFCFFLIFLGYLYFRLVILDFNPSYLPIWDWKVIATPLIYTLGLLVLPILALLLSHLPKSFVTDPAFRKSFFPFLPFLGLLITPYLGHPFFSPGWLLLPGFFSLWALFFCLPDSYSRKLSPSRVALITFIISSIPVFFQVHRLRWLEWVHSQKQMETIIKNLPETTSQIWVETCGDVARPDLSIQRIIGAEDNLSHLWRLHHSQYIPIKFFSCHDPNLALGPTSVAKIRWDFHETKLMTPLD